MFTTLRKDSMEDVGKGPLKMGDAMYQHTACVHCKRRKLRCSGDRPACARCESEGVNQCTYPERKPTLATKRKAEAASKKPCKSPRTDSLSPKMEGRERPRASSKAWTVDEADNGGDMCLESPMHALASANEMEGENAVHEQAMCQFTSLFEDGVDLGIEESKFLLLEHESAQFGVDSDASSVPSLLNPHNLSTPSSTYDLDAYFSPLTPAEPPSTTWPPCTFPALSYDPTTPSAHGGGGADEKPSPAPVPRCKCIKAALFALEDIPVLTDVADTRLVEYTLAACKTTLSAYETVLQCASCSASTSATITALVVAEELVCTLSRLRRAVAVRKTDPLSPGAWTQTQTQTQVESEGAVVVSAEGGDRKLVHLLLASEDVARRRLAVGAYSVNGCREWASVLGALTVVQLERLERVLGIVRARIEKGEGEGKWRVMIVRRLEERVREAVGRRFDE